MSEKTKELLELQAKDQYKSHQEDLAFAKELNILRNDYYYQMTDYGERICLLDFLYHPRDVMSGDAYSARRIDENTTLYLVVDGMGKGLSASLTAMIFTSFANHVVDKMIGYHDFDLRILVHETIEYIKPILLEEESLSVDYVLADNSEQSILYAKFAMPPIFLQDKENNILKIKSNNPPISKYTPTFNINNYDMSEITKFLICSDGMVENETKFNERPYSDFIEEDFLNAFTREDLSHSFLQKIDTQDDDITLIFVNKIIQDTQLLDSKRFESKLANLDVANEWYENIWSGLTNNKNCSYKAEMVFTELFMNAHEHGNLAIPSRVKHSLMESDTYFETLKQREIDCEKYIDVKVEKLTYLGDKYIVTKITDEGEGFNTQILSEIFRNSRKFHGRGVFVSRKNSFGIYYNAKGNSVLYINKIEDQTS
jgi:serine/threonine protein phosphatase PrpC